MSHNGMHRLNTPYRDRIADGLAALGSAFTRRGPWGQLVDWLRVAWRNLTAGANRPATVATSPDRGIGGYPVCLTCRHNAHRGCGWMADDPPCGCGCTSAAMGRRAHEDRQVQAL